MTKRKYYIYLTIIWANRNLHWLEYRIVDVLLLNVIEREWISDTVYLICALYKLHGSLVLQKNYNVANNFKKCWGRIRLCSLCIR